MPEQNHCNQCAIHNNNPLKMLQDEQLHDVSRCKTNIVFEKGDVIFKEGSTLAGVYCISQGFCKLSKLCPNGKIQIVRFACKGDILGQRSVISREAVNLTATALTHVKACFIPKDIIFESFASNGKFSTEIFRNVCSELRKADDAIVDFAQKTAKQRLASSLLFLEEIFGKDPQAFINVQLSREEIGNMIGSATESLIRMLSDFTKNKWIETHSKRIKILDRKQLEKISFGD
ncbi:Crp/Fnr family transcriptional regulator [Capnocytophaga sp.]|uniref:Crp/Fnr family transcriptional regulator n=1 Tax=Capnocytophaga sp. TaxID=44737 RepID=UPI0026DD66E6|nr:Crp/Fnr family transcriptional regulator [Capnocytophaga sp.]MDO5104320.1 Crp/Fnr family transcriptional regulator [Capnocytophaga sp.]